MRTEHVREGAEIESPIMDAPYVLRTCDGVERFATLSDMAVQAHSHLLAWHKEESEAGFPEVADAVWHQDLARLAQMAEGRSMGTPVPMDVYSVDGMTILLSLAIWRCAICHKVKSARSVCAECGVR